jgi:hypothetical protein
MWGSIAGKKRQGEALQTGSPRIIYGLFLTGLFCRAKHFAEKCSVPTPRYCGAFYLRCLFDRREKITFSKIYFLEIFLIVISRRYSLKASISYMH